MICVAHSLTSIPNKERGLEKQPTNLLVIETSQFSPSTKGEDHKFILRDGNANIIILSTIATSSNPKMEKRKRSQPSRHIKFSELAILVAKTETKRKEKEKEHKSM